MIRFALPLLVLCSLAANAALTDLLPKTAYSSDKFVEVISVKEPEDEIGFRFPLVHFAGEEIEALKGTFRIEPQLGKGPSIVIVAGEGRTNDTRVLVKRLLRNDGSRYTRITLPSPCFSDIGDLRGAISEAFFYTWGNVPDWVSDGALRCSDRVLAEYDTRYVLEKWESAALPCLADIVRNLKRTKEDDAAYAAYIVGWLREKKEFARLLAKSGESGTWAPDALLKLLTGEENAALQDRANDEHLIRLSRSVLHPGRVSQYDLKRFVSKLDLYPPQTDLHFKGGSDCCTPRQALETYRDDVLLRMAACLKLRELPVLVIGRGEDMKRIYLEYHAFFMAIVNDSDKAEATRLLDKAESDVKALADTLS